MEFHIIIEDDYVDICDLKRQNTIYKCLVITNYFILRIYGIKNMHICIFQLGMHIYIHA